MPKNEHFDRLYELLQSVHEGHEQPSKTEDIPKVSDQLAAYILWLDVDPLIPERTYSILLDTQSTTVQVTDLSFKIDTKTHSQLAAKKLFQNEYGYCKLSLGESIF